MVFSYLFKVKLPRYLLKDERPPCSPTITYSDDRAGMDSGGLDLKEQYSFGGTMQENEANERHKIRRI